MSDPKMTPTEALELVARLRDGITPGPWRCMRADHGPMDVYDGKRRDIVTVYGGGVGSSEKLPNARLIAAAPDLLDAIEVLARALAERPPLTWEAVAPAMSFPEGWRDRNGGMNIKLQGFWADGYNCCRERIADLIPAEADHAARVLAQLEGQA